MGMFFGTILKTMGAIHQGKAEQAAADYNAQLADRNALITTQQTEAAKLQQKRDSAKHIGGMRAAYSASGVSLEGSALDVLEESASQAELDYQNIGYQGELKRMGFESEAAMERMRGKNAVRAGYLKASSILLSDMGSAFAGAPKRT